MLAPESDRFWIVAAFVLGSAGGGVLRYGVAQLCAERCIFGERVGLGTLLVNAAGSFLFAWTIAHTLAHLGPWSPVAAANVFRLSPGWVFLAGIAGGLTTFSTLMAEALASRHGAVGVLNRPAEVYPTLVVNTLVCAVCALIGYGIA